MKLLNKKSLQKRIKIISFYLILVIFCSLYCAFTINYKNNLKSFPDSLEKIRNSENLLLQDGDNWWESSYKFRAPINITNKDKIPLPKGYTINMSINTLTLISTGRLRADGKDFRVVWYNSSNETWLELDRINETKFNRIDTQIWFKTQSIIDPGETDNSYYLYYGYEDANNPPSNKSKIYDFYDDFTQPDGPAEGWSNTSGSSWTVINNVYREDEGVTNRRSILNSYTVENASIEIRLKSSGGTSICLGLLFRYQNSNNLYVVALGAWQSEVGFGKWTNGNLQKILTTASNNSELAYDHWYNLKLDVLGSQYLIYLDGILKINTTHSDNLSVGQIGLITWTTSSTSYFDDLKIKKLITKAPVVMIGLEENQPTFKGWWNLSYKFRTHINITNKDKIPLPKGYTINMSVNTLTLISTGRSRANGKDFRVVWYNSSNETWLELDRINETKFNRIDTQIWFKTQSIIDPGETDNNYYLYYGYEDANDPPSNKSKIYDFYDDFTQPDGPAEGWSNVSGSSWTVINNEYRENEFKNNLRSLLNSYTVENASIEIRLKSSGGTDIGLGVIFRYMNSDNLYAIALGGWQREVGFGKWINGTLSQVAVTSTTESVLAYGHWYDFRVDILGSQYLIYLDGTLKINTSDIHHLNAGRVGLITYTTSSTSYFDDLKIKLLVAEVPSVDLGIEETFGTQFNYIVESADPLELGNTEIITVNITDLVDIIQVLIEIDEINHSMNHIGCDLWQYDSWVPINTGKHTYKIHSQNLNFKWSSINDLIHVIDSTPPSYSDLDESADPLELGATETISIKIYDLSGIEHALIEIEGINYTMSNIGGDIWQYDAWTPSSTGTYSYTIYMEDIDGNWNSVTELIEVVDNASPSYSDLDESADPLELGATETISINVYDNAGINQVLIEIEGINYTMTNIGGDTWQYDAWTPSSTGTYSYTIHMEDVDGNWNSVTESIEVVDNAPPEIIIYEPNPYDQFGITAPEINIEIIDNNLDSIWYQLIGIISTDNYSWTGMIYQDLWDLFDSGMVIIKFYANDSMGNLVSASVTVKKDITAPDIMIIEPSPYDLFGKVVPYVDIEVEDQNLDAIWCKLFNSTQSIFDYSWTGSIKQSIWDEFNSGILTIRFYANDTLGNTRFLDITIVKDITPPDLIFYKPNLYDLYGVIPPILDIFIYDDDLDHVWYQLSNGLVTTKNYTWTGIISQDVWGELGNGTIKILFYANDTLSNHATQSIIIRKDIIAPSIFINYPSDYSVFGTSPPNIDINVVEPNLGYIWYQINNGTVKTGNYSWTGIIEQNIWDQVGNGTISIFIYSNDTIGNLGSMILTIRKDIIAPKIIIEKPKPYNLFGNSSPIINVEFYDPHLFYIRYQLKNETFSTINYIWTGIIEQNVWDLFGNGSVTLTIYANDSLGNLGIESLQTHKDIIAPFILIEYPNSYEVFGKSAPDVSVLFDDKNLNSTWYQLKNESIITLKYIWTGTLEQNIWDEVGNGIVTIIFYADDLMGNLGYREITILKDLSAPIINIVEPEGFEIFGFISPEFRIYISGIDVDHCWYKVDGYKDFFIKSDVITNIKINQAKWDEFGNGTVIVEFYVNDSVGNIGFDIIKLRKDVFAPEVKINLPIYEGYWNKPPILNISVIDPNFDTLWYRIGTSNVALINNMEQMIDTLIWNNLEQGEFQIHIFANDSAGNINNTFSFTLFKDTLAPLIDMILPINNSYTNFPPILDIICFDPNFNALWYGDEKINISLTNNTNQSLDWEIWNNLPDGAYQLFIYANDTFGHLNDLFILTLYKDTNAPEMIIYSPNNSTFYNQPPVLDIYAFDPNLHTLWYEIGDFTRILQNHIGQEIDQLEWNNLPQGEFQLYIYANDSFGYLNNSFSLTLYKDTLAPRVVINLPYNHTYWNSRPSINITVYDPNLDKLWYKIATEYIWLENNTETLISDYIWSNLPEGQFIIEIYANDYLGQINNTYKLILYKDTLAPDITINYPYSPYFGNINAPKYDISITEANLEKVWYLLVGYPKAFQISDFIGNIDQTAWNSFGNGTVIIRFYANDTMGNIRIRELNFRKDIYTPIVKINLPINQTVWDSSPIINITVSDPNLETIWYRIGTIYSKLNNNVEQQINNIIWENLPQGELLFYFYANDSAGNINDTCHLSLYKDTLAPNIHINLPIEGQKIGKIAPFFDITITDDNLATRWYSLNDGLTNITFSNNTGQIDQQIWDEIWESHTSDDLITLRFYANDTLNHIGSQDIIIVIKKSTNWPEFIRLSGLIFTGSLGVVLVLTTITVNINKKFKRMDKEQQKKVNTIFYLSLTLISLLILSYFI